MVRAICKYLYSQTLQTTAKTFAFIRQFSPYGAPWMCVHCEPMQSTNTDLQHVDTGNVAARTGPTHMVEMIFPDQTNHYGTLFGGNALKLLSQAAFVTASRFAPGHFVMAACHDVVFHRPVRQGQVLNMTGLVTRVGRSSLTVVVTATVEDLCNGTCAPALDSHFEMVAVGADGRPVALPSSATHHPVNTARAAVPATAI